MGRWDSVHIYFVVQCLFHKAQALRYFFWAVVSLISVSQFNPCFPAYYSSSIDILPFSQGKHQAVLSYNSICWKVYYTYASDVYVVGGR
jgi:hypothetical protein